MPNRFLVGAAILHFPSRASPPVLSRPSASTPQCRLFRDRFHPQTQAAAVDRKIINSIIHHTIIDEGRSPMSAPATPASARASLTEDAKALHLVEFWEQRADVELRQPRNKARPFRWRWADIEPRLRLAAKTVPIEECERRALVFANPGLDGKPYITNTLFAAYSLYNPGERAPVHRHTPSASRFVLDGDGGFTVVEGEKLRMCRGDLILTPTGTWHDHGNAGEQAVSWVDVLNVPLVESPNATQFQFDYREDDAQSTTGAPIPKQLQTVREVDDHSQRLYGTGGVKPLFVS